MPVSVVVGGQYGSEGKGKVALELARRDPNISIVVRPGGTNSGHTGYTKDGRRMVLRQLPAAAIDGHTTVVLPAGSYIDVALLHREILELGLPRSRLVIDPRAHVIRQEHIAWEQRAALTENIGSTGSGTGSAVLSRLARMAPKLPAATLAGEVPELLQYIEDSMPIMRAALSAGQRILIEGTQGFGLSPLHGDAWPKATSRDTTAAAFVSEAGLSPLDVDQIVLVIRSFPIRVAGDSGPLVNETSWHDIATNSGGPFEQGEQTSVTNKLRRVGTFEAVVVRRAIAHNRPTAIVLNHLDQVDYSIHGTSALSSAAEAFVAKIESLIEQKVDLFGTGPRTLTPSRLGILCDG